MKKVITGNHAVSTAVRLVKPEVIAVYPITPQTSISEKLAEFCADGTLVARFVRVESEHSAMATLIGAAAAGARTFTATSSQGLALMHEVLHWAAGDRLPIVMANVNRALGAPWCLGADHLDSLSQRDTGWMQFYCESNQEAVDTILQAYRLAEKVLLPAMVMLDGFILSHTVEPVDIPEQNLVDQFLPRWEAPYKLDPEEPHSFGGIATANEYFEFRYKAQRAMEEALYLFDEVAKEYENFFGRLTPAIETVAIDDAEFILVATGSIASTCRWVVEEQRKKGKKIGLLKIKMVRPFPAERIRAVLPPHAPLIVLDRNLSLGLGGIIQEELKSALYPEGFSIPIYGVVTGLGGRDVTPNLIEEILDRAEREQLTEKSINWLGVHL